MDRYEYKILNCWSDNDDLYVDYIVRDNSRHIQVHTCTLFDNNDFKSDTTKDDLEQKLINVLKENYGAEYTLPKTSELNDITYKIFKELCQSDNNMLWIEDQDDYEYYKLNEINYQLLKQDIDKYNLEDYFDISRDNITVYGGLQCCFNDDREERSEEHER